MERGHLAIHEGEIRFDLLLYQMQKQTAATLEL